MRGTTFIIRRLDGLYLCVLSCMEDLVSGRLHFEECWHDNFDMATRFDGRIHHRVIDMYDDTYPYFLANGMSNG